MTPGPQAPRRYADSARPWWQRMLVSRDAAMIAVLALTVVVALATVDNFSSPVTATYLVLDVAPIVMLALPMTLVIITGEIDLSVASTVGLSSVLIGALYQAGLPMAVAVAVALAAGLLAGLVNGLLVTVVGLPSLAVTIGTLALYRGLAVGVLGTAAVTDFPDSWTGLVKAKLFGTVLPLVTVLLVVLALVFAVVLHLTSFGRGLYAIGLSNDTAVFSGVGVRRAKILLFMATGFTAALVGVYYTLRYGSARGDNASGMELSVIAAVLLGGVSIFGGRGAIPGVLAGAFLIGVLASALRLAGITSDVISILTGSLLVLSVVLTSVLSWVTRRRQTAAAKRSVQPPHEG